MEEVYNQIIRKKYICLLVPQLEKTAGVVYYGLNGGYFLSHTLRITDKDGDKFRCEFIYQYFNSTGEPIYEIEKPIYLNVVLEHGNGCEQNMGTFNIHNGCIEQYHNVDKYGYVHYNHIIRKI